MLQTITRLGAVAAAFAALATPAHGAAGWFSGTSDAQSGQQCFGGPTGYGQNTSTTVSYWTDPQAGYPAVGDRYWMQLHTGAVGFSCPWGISDIATELLLPDATVPAVNLQSADKDDRVRCFYLGSNDTQWREVTDFTWTAPWDSSVKGKWCDSTKVPTMGQYGYSLGYRLLSQGTQFRVILPVVSTKRLAGMGAPGSTSKAVGAITSGVNTTAVPYQWTTVFDRLPAVSYPADATTAITDTTVTTKGIVDTWYRPGRIYVDLGAGAGDAFQSTAGPFAVDASHPQYTVTQGWTQLTPGTDHRWRVRFVADDGATATGAVRTFRTTGTAPSGGGTPTTPAPQPGGGGTPPAQQEQQPPAQQEQPATQHQQQPVAPSSPGGTPTTPVMPPPPPTADTTAPTLALTLPRPRLAAPLAFAVSCDEACSSTVELRVDRTTARKLRLKGTVLAIGKGTRRAGRSTVTVRLPAAARRLKRLRVAVTVTVSDAAGNAAVRKATLTLKR